MPEGNDDGPETPDLRSLDDIFESFGDSKKSFRDRIEGGEGGEEEKIEETEKEKRDREERERIKALTSAGTTNVFNTPGRETEIMKELFRADRLKHKDDKDDEDDE